MNVASFFRIGVTFERRSVHISAGLSVSWGGTERGGDGDGCWGATDSSTHFMNGPLRLTKMLILHRIGKISILDTCQCELFFLIFFFLC